MTTISKSVTYSFFWQVKSLPHYKVTKDGKIVNCRTMTELKRTVNGYTIGYNIQGKFHSLSKLRNMLEKIQVVECPF